MYPACEHHYPHQRHDPPSPTMVHFWLLYAAHFLVVKRNLRSRRPGGLVGFPNFTLLYLADTSPMLQHCN